jgi:class 3 adenylate cyclase/CheY-like chemotaxis protein
MAELMDHPIASPHSCELAGSGFPELPRLEARGDVELGAIERIDELVRFIADVAPPVAERPYARAWKVLVVDDDAEVHDVTRLALAGLRIDGRAIVLVSARSGQAARTALRADPDIAVVLLDVVMETDDAGLALARWIRRDLGNTRVRIVLRTGQPGRAPEQRVMFDYDIHDYRDKTELTARRLTTTVISALRSYRDLCTIDGQKAGLERLLAATSTLFAAQSVDSFAGAVLRELAALVGARDGALFLLGREPGPVDAPAVVAGAGRFERVVGRSVADCVDEEVWFDISLLLRSGRPVRRARYQLLALLRGAQPWAAVLLEGRGELGPWEQHLVELFCHHVSSALDNHRLHQRQSALADAFARFVPQRLLELLGRPHATDADLGDHVQSEMTVMFVDLRGFTARAEQLEPPDTFEFLNGFFAAVVPAIHEHGGVVDKYLGDGLMALFPESPQHAVEAALEVLARASERGTRIGVGIHVGPVTLGLVGADGRIESTVVSDAVNVAARIERLTRRFGVDLLVTADVHSRLSPGLRAESRPLGTAEVHGKQRPVAIYEVFSADPEELRAGKATTREAVAAAVTAIQERRLSEAERILGALAAEHPRDPALSALTEECCRRRSVTLL